MNKRNYSLKAAPTATSKEQKSQNSPKAKRIVLGVDVHLRSYQAARKIDNSAIGPVATFRSQAELLLHIENQRKLAQEVAVVYEAGPLGYVLYRELEAEGIRCFCLRPGQPGAAKPAAQEQQHRRQEFDSQPVQLPQWQ